MSSSFSSSSSSSSYMHAAVAFNKVAGTLSLDTDQTIRWVPSSATSGVTPFQIRFTDIAGLQTSKAGAAQIALMLVLANGVQVASKPKALLVFNAAQQTALEDRERFKTELAAAVGRNKAIAEGSGSATPLTPASPAPATATASPAAAATRGTTPDTRSGTPTRASSSTAAAAAAASSPIPSKRPRAAQPAAKTDIELRISVIKSNPSLRALHKDIVISGQMSDAEFWSHPSRQRLVRSERAKLEQRAGRNARLADPKPTPNEAGELKLSITPELIRDLFEQFPVVARAYEENVPSKLDEASFWSRYFQSKLYHRLRTSARSAASEHIVQDDAIFDAYLTEEDNGLEPQHKVNPHDRLLDLEATEEDRGESGNGKDWTMRAGAERRTLPLMRRFNGHSQSLLDDALGRQEEGAKRRRIVGGVGEEYAQESGNPPKTGGDVEDGVDGDAADSIDWIKEHYYKEIVIDDLNETSSNDKVRLSVANLEGYFSGSRDAPEGANGVSSASSAEVVPTSIADYLSHVERFNSQLTASIDLGNFRPLPSGTQASMARMLTNLRSRSLNPRSSADIKTLPEPIQKQLISLQASMTEFLRQFWNAVAPQPDDQEWTARSSLAEQESRKRQEEEDRLVAAGKMARNLTRFEERLEDVLVSGGVGGAGDEVEEKVRVLLGPTTRAVQRAVGVARRRGLV